MSDEVVLNECEVIDYIDNNFKEGALIEITYNRVFIPGKLLYFEYDDGDMVLTLQLQGELLSQVVDININNILDDIIEICYTYDDNETILVVK